MGTPFRPLRDDLFDPSQFSYSDDTGVRCSHVPCAIYGQIIETTGTTRRPYGTQGFTPSTGGAAIANATTNFHPLQRVTTTTVSGNTAGYNYSTTQGVRPGFYATFSCVVGTDASSIANYAVQSGLSSAGQSFDLASASGVIATYDTSIDSTAFWRVAVNDGSAGAVRTTTTVPIAANTRYEIQIYLWPTKSEVWINGVLAHREVSRIPSASTDLYAMQWSATRTTASKTMDFGSSHVRFPHGRS